MLMELNKYLMINNGDDVTRTRKDTLNLKIRNDNEKLLFMSFSDDCNNWSAWEPFKPERSYTLTENNGLKTVYLKLKDQAGNVAEPINAKIYLNEPEEERSNTDLTSNQVFQITIFLIIILIMVIIIQYFIHKRNNRGILNRKIGADQSMKIQDILKNAKPAIPLKQSDLRIDVSTIPKAKPFKQLKMKET